jgi:hypothetical protein
MRMGIANHTSDKPLKAVVRPMRNGGFAYEITFASNQYVGLDTVPDAEAMRYVSMALSPVAEIIMGEPLRPEIECAIIAKDKRLRKKYGVN